MSAPSLRELATAVFVTVNGTVGGGHVSIELLRRRFTARGWLDATSHGVLVAVSRFTPGTVVLAYCVTLGWRFHGWGGVAVALAAASVPCTLIVVGLAYTLTRIDQYRAVRALLAAGVLVASVLVLSSAWYLIRPYLAPGARLRALVITSVSVALIVFGATPVRVLLAAAVVSAVLPLGKTTR